MGRKLPTPTPVEHSYSKKMLESGDNQIKKKIEGRTKYTTANDQTRTNTRLNHQPATKDSVSARDATKMSGKGAAAAHAAGDRFLPLTFSHNGASVSPSTAS